MEVIAHAATSAIFDVQRMTGVPIVFGVLTVLSIEQAKERAESELGGSWGEAALAQVRAPFMININRNMHLLLLLTKTIKVGICFDPVAPFTDDDDTSFLLFEKSHL